MKRKNLLLISVFCFVVAFTLILAAPAFAAPLVQIEAPPPIDVILQLASAAFFGLVGLPALFGAITTLLMMFGKITQETADKLHVWLNTVAYGAVFIAVVFGRVDLVSQIDAYLGGIATILAAIISVLSGLFSFAMTQFIGVYSASNSLVQRKILRAQRLE